MRIQHVDYDLSRPGQNYDGLIAELEKTGSWARPCKSAWLIATTETSSQLRDRLLKQIDANDRLLVIDVTGSTAAWNGLSKEISDWILANING